MFLPLAILIISAVPFQGFISWMQQIPEVKQLYQAAEARGLEVGFFGGAASTLSHSFVHKKVKRPNQMDQVLFPSQDLDLVVRRKDGKPENAADLEYIYSEAVKIFPFRRVDVFGSKVDWIDPLGKQRVRLLDNNDFCNQHLDSESTSVVFVGGSQDLVFDFCYPEITAENIFKRIKDKKIIFRFSDSHHQTSRSLADLNPPIISVIRYAIKKLRLDLSGDAKSEQKIKSIIQAFTGETELSDYAFNWIVMNAPKLLEAPQSLQTIWNYLDGIGLREKLIALAEYEESYALDIFGRLPLDYKLPKIQSEKKKARTAKDLGITHVAHETGREAFLSIMLEAASDVPLRAFISRENHEIESALHGEGFYTKLGLAGEGGENSGLHIVFEVDPRAQEGRDFIYVEEKKYVVWKNSFYLKINRSLSSDYSGTLPNIFITLKDSNLPKNQRVAALVAIAGSKDLRDIFFKTLNHDFDPNFSEEGSELLAVMAGLSSFDDPKVSSSIDKLIEGYVGIISKDKDTLYSFLFSLAHYPGIISVSLETKLLSLLSESIISVVSDRLYTRSHWFLGLSISDKLDSILARVPRLTRLLMGSAFGHIFKSLEMRFSTADSYVSQMRKFLRMLKVEDRHDFLERVSRYGDGLLFRNVLASVRDLEQNEDVLALTYFDQTYMIRQILAWSQDGSIPIPSYQVPRLVEFIKSNQAVFNIFSGMARSSRPTNPFVKFILEHDAFWESDRRGPAPSASWIQMLRDTISSTQSIPTTSCGEALGGLSLQDLGERRSQQLGSRTRGQ